MVSEILGFLSHKGGGVCLSIRNKKYMWLRGGDLKGF